MTPEHFPSARVPAGPLAPGAGDAPLPIEPLLTAAQVSRILGVRPKRVYELGIPTVRISEKSLRWRRSDLEAWIDRRRGAA